MSISGSTNYNVTRNDIIDEALELLEVYGPDDTVSDNDYTSCARTLEMMTKTLASQGVGLWKIKNCALFLGYEEYEYTIGKSSINHATSSYIKTEIATAGVATDTTIAIDSITGISDNYDRDGIITATTPAGAGAITLSGTLVSSSIAYLPSERPILIYSDGDDSGVTFTIVGADGQGVSVTEVVTGPNATTVYSTNTFKTVTSVTISGAGTGNIEVGVVGDHIGIELDDGTMQWTYISGATSATAMPLKTALTGSAGIDNHVYVYTEKLERPLELLEVRFHRSDDSEYPIEIITRQEYMELSNKTYTGDANQVYYHRGRRDGTLYVWPGCDDVKNWITFSAKVAMEDFDLSTNDADFPAEWFFPLSQMLAVAVAPKFQVNPSQSLMMMATQSLEQMKDADHEYGSITFGVK